MSDKIMSGEKVVLDEKDILNLLSNQHNQSVANITKIYSGKHSQAYSYGCGGAEYILRLSTNDFGFKKDVHVYETFGTTLPIPKIIGQGEIQPGHYFCISEKVSGESVRDQYNQNNFDSFHQQFEMIETIRKSAITTDNFGTLNPEGEANLQSLGEHIETEYQKLDWDDFEKLSYFDRGWLDSLRDKLKANLKFSENVHELVHGDFGNDNVIMQNSEIMAVIDWEKLYCGDAFYDVGRVVLYCPRRDLSTQAALDYYSQTHHQDFRERILAGVYFTMMINYGMAARAEKEESCKSSPQRIREIENVLLS